MKSVIYIILFFNIVFASIISSAEDLVSGINPNEFNYLVRPQDSLYDHVNSEWLNNTPIPDDQVGWGSYMTLREESYSNQDMLIKKIIERIEKNNSFISDEELKIANLYKSFIDRDKVNKLGYQPILPELEKGIALKIIDGGTRASECAIASLLIQLGVLNPDHPTARAYTHAPILNWRKIQTGIMKASNSFKI